MKYFILFFSLLIFGFGKSQTVDPSKITEIKNFVKGKNYNQDIAFFIDFKIPSGKFRFFIYDLKENKMIDQGLVAHGSGSEGGKDGTLNFSNIENSYQSSLGKYEIANSYVGTFGKSYRLKGLDKTNSNALKRAIVMHSLSCVGNAESSQPTCLSLGCPMLSEEFFKTAATYIDHSKRPIILYAFY